MPRLPDATLNRGIFVRFWFWAADRPGSGNDPRYDVHASLMSLPHLVGTTLATVPASIPYLHADPALGLSVAQLELLSCITEHPGIRPSQLARMLRLAPSSVATLLGGLQSAGYVMRTPGADSDGDRRTVSLNLSDAGAQAVSRWHRVNEDIIRVALAELPHRDRAALRDAAPALRDLTTSIDAQAD